MGEYAAAAAAFDAEEKQGAIKRSALYVDLAKLRAEAGQKAREEAEDAEHQRRMTVAAQEVRRLGSEADELYKAGKLEEALVRLAQAQKAADLLDTALQEQIRDRAQKIRKESADRQEQAARAERIDKMLEAGRRLLLERQPTEAKIKFDEVLAFDARQPEALKGKAEAEAAILAITTQQERAEQYRHGRERFERGDYEGALKPLAEAAVDPANADARELLQRAQKILRGVREQKDLRLRTEQLLAEGERLLEQRKFPEAVVKLTAVMELDRTLPRARERLNYAERMTSHQMADRMFPNQRPTLVFSERPAAIIEAPKVAVVGIAGDDRGVARVEYSLDGQVIARRSFEPDGETGEFPRNVEVMQVFALEPGAHRIGVAVIDSNDLAGLESFEVRRRLRFYETRAFLPSAAAGAVGLVGVGYAAQRLRRRRAVRRRFNPYIAGAPVMDEEMFFGRQKLLSRILNVLHHNSLMITGERRIGKTTFLYRLKKALEADEGTEYHFFPVFTDLQGVAEESFFHALMADVVDTLKLSESTLAALRFRPDGDGYDGRDFSHDMQRIIEELHTRTSRKVKLVLLIDEVDVLNQYSERVNQRLRSIFMKTFAEHLVAVMSGVGLKRTWTSEGSPWYNFFDEVELTAFTREEAEALVRQPVEGIFRYDPQAVEAILERSQLKPYVIQKYCIHAVNRMLEQGRTTITAEDVDAVREDVHFEATELPAMPARRQASA
jgi:tetratricopeptide (TPR) repeat protein